MVLSISHKLDLMKRLKSAWCGTLDYLWSDTPLIFIASVWTGCGGPFSQPTGCGNKAYPFVGYEISSQLDNPYQPTLQAGILYIISAWQEFWQFRSFQTPDINLDMFNHSIFLMFLAISLSGGMSYKDKQNIPTSWWTVLSSSNLNPQLN